MIHILWNVFDAMPTLAGSVAAADRALKGIGRSHYFVDGRYPAFPGEHDYSTDNTRIFAASAGILIDAAVDECEKRTAGLRAIDQIAVEGDWVLVLDADEELTEFNPHPVGRVGIIRFRRDSDLMEYPRARLYRWTPGLRFGRRHLYLFDAEADLVAGLTDGCKSAVCGSGIHHDLCSPERKRAKDIYYRWLAQHEEEAIAK